jgi:hypothetical protein
MALKTILAEQRHDIIDTWVKQVLATYSPDAAQIFHRKKDRFANPIGYNVKAGLAECYDSLAGDGEPELGKQMEELVKVRAVQQFQPSAAIAFVFEIKDIVRQFGEKLKMVLEPADLFAFDGRVDQMALLVFDCYMGCRERLNQVRIRELESNRHILTDNAVCPSRLTRDKKQA